VEEYKWNLCGNLKDVPLLLGTQFGYTKHCYFLCDWDSRDKKYHYVNQLWHKWSPLTPVDKNILNPILVLPEKIYLPPLYIKMGLKANFVKGTDKISCWFEYMRNKFPNVRDAKIKEDIFIGSQIRELMQDKHFDENRIVTERMHVCHLRVFARTSCKIT